MQVKYTNFVSYRLLFFIKICWNSFFSSSYDLASASASIISSNVITKLSVIFATYFHHYMKKGSKYNLLHTYDDFYTCINIYHYSTLNLNYTFFHEIYMYICMIHVWLMFSIILFL